MEIQIRYPVGVQSFTRIREGGYLYVDKTAISYRLVNTCDCVFFSRPRRFGKILMMSTLKAYLKGKRELFEGLPKHTLHRIWPDF